MLFEEVVETGQDFSGVSEGFDMEPAELLQPAFMATQAFLAQCLRGGMHFHRGSDLRSSPEREVSRRQPQQARHRAALDRNTLEVEAAESVDRCSRGVEHRGGRAIGLFSFERGVEQNVQIVRPTFADELDDAVSSLERGRRDQRAIAPDLRYEYFRIARVGIQPRTQPA